MTPTESTTERHALAAPRNGPADRETLEAALPRAQRAALDDALTALIERGVIVRQHLQTLPPRVLYRAV